MTALVTHCKSRVCSRFFFFFYQLSVCIAFSTRSFKIYSYLKENLYCFKRVLICDLWCETNKQLGGIETGKTRTRLWTGDDGGFKEVGWQGPRGLDGQLPDSTEAELSLKNGAWPISKGQKPREATHYINHERLRLTCLVFQPCRTVNLNYAWLRGVEDAGSRDDNIRRQ